MERWAIEIEKEYLKFSAAHFLIFPDGSAERLHGHNYRVYCEVSGSLSKFGLVIDFTQVKPLIKKIVDELDEHWLLPGDHHELVHSVTDKGLVEVTYRERYYAAPQEDVIVLPINNTSAENLASYVGRRLLEDLQVKFSEVEVDSLRIAVEETQGQRGVWYFNANT
ncbi:MAG: 6-carboxytetrahydropterin synthase [Planctomycetota bacterium]|nr:6-carboxytetrahydropterin synthase [Planctomycetota bacterium]